jgi:hypothetical protein
MTTRSRLSKIERLRSGYDERSIVDGRPEVIDEPDVGDLFSGIDDH